MTLLKMAFLKQTLIGFLVLLFSLPAFAKGEQAGAFDFYVLALSWSPSFCATQGRNSDGPQCASDADYGFVVHGLWPQYERGYPEFCETNQKTWLDEDLIDSMVDIMPSRSLIIYQWRKHGQCSGLSSQEYFALMRRAFERVRVPQSFNAPAARKTESPDTIEKSFLGSNAAMDEDGVAITCDRRHFREVRICLTKDLRPRDCEEVDAKSCNRRQIIIPTIE